MQAAAAVDESETQLDLTSNPVQQEHCLTDSFLIVRPMRINSAERPKTETAPKLEMVAKEQIQCLCLKTEIKTTLFIPTFDVSKPVATEETELIDSPNEISEDDAPKRHMANILRK